MLLVEKSIAKNVLAQIKRFRRYDENDKVTGYEYAILVCQKSDEQIGMQRVGKVSRYASYDTLAQAQNFFIPRYGDILPKHLRGLAKANYLNSLEMSDDSEKPIRTQNKSVQKSPTLVVKSANIEKIKVKKPEKIGILDKIRAIVDTCVSANYNRIECQEYLTSDNFKEGSITRILNEKFGKVVKTPKVFQGKTVSITKAKVVPIPVAKTKAETIQDKLIQARKAWKGHDYDVQKDLKTFEAFKAKCAYKALKMYA